MNTFQDKKFRKYFFKYLMLKELKESYNPVVALVTRKKITQESDIGCEDGEHFVWRTKILSSGRKNLMRATPANTYTLLWSLPILFLITLVCLIFMISLIKTIINVTVNHHHRPLSKWENIYYVVLIICWNKPVVFLVTKL